MTPEQEALRLSSLIALCIGLYLITLSVDNFRQAQMPGRIGELDCTWWRTHFGGCEAHDAAHKRWTLHQETKQTGARRIRL